MSNLTRLDPFDDLFRGFFVRPVEMGNSTPAQSPVIKMDVKENADSFLVHAEYVTTCAHCGGAVRIVASIEDPKAIRAILAHFEKHGALEQAHYRPAPRAPPPAA